MLSGMNIIFSRVAFREFAKLERSVQKKIHEKLCFYCSSVEPLSFADTLQDSRYGQYRFRIGDYRVLFDVEEGSLMILRIGHRKDVYK